MQSSSGKDVGKRRSKKRSRDGLDDNQMDVERNVEPKTTRLTRPFLPAQRHGVGVRDVFDQVPRGRGTFGGWHESWKDAPSPWLWNPQFRQVGVNLDPRVLQLRFVKEITPHHTVPKMDHLLLGLEKCGDRNLARNNHFTNWMV